MGRGTDSGPGRDTIVPVNVLSSKLNQPGLVKDSSSSDVVIRSRVRLLS